MSGIKLNDRQELFCLEYMKDLNATQAAIRAGYSENTAANIGFENLRKPNIQNRISELLEERNNAVKVDAQYVLKRLLEIDQMDVKDILNDDGTIKPILEWPKSWRTTLSGMDITELSNDGDIEAILKKVKWPDKVRNLELLGKHVDVSAFQEVVRATTDLHIKDYTDMTLEEASDAYKKLMG